MMHRKKRHGFSLVEVMVVIAIFSVIGGAIMSFLLIGGASWHSGDAQVQASEEVRKGMSAMVRELRQTRTSTITGVPADGLYYNSIIFRIPSDIDGDGDVITSTGSVEWSNPIQYSLNNGQLLRTISGTTTVLANNIMELQFRREEMVPDVLEISLRAQKTTLEGRVIQMNLKCKIKMRN